MREYLTGLRPPTVSRPPDVGNLKAHAGKQASHN